MTTADDRTRDTTTGYLHEPQGAHMTTDRYSEGYRDGYKAADKFHQARGAKAEKVITLWTRPGKDKVRGLIRKHWPELAQALDDLEGVESW